ncbi:MAG: M23 family metallopeptidase [Gammaproteobacteria bacterium]|nr:M23 family metallopeptidase [Gammaproteobacteria bacterium]
MNVIFFSRRVGKARHLNLAHPVTLGVASLCGIALLVSVFLLGLHLGEQRHTGSNARAEVISLKTQLQDRVDGLALRTGQLSAQLLRLNALGKRLAQMANINSHEFDFDRDPPQGGPEGEEGGRGVDLAHVDFMLDQLQQHIDLRGAQLGALENVILGRQLSAEIRPSGRPVQGGYVSSAFGERMDPFDGEEAFHKGVDFAADAGSAVLAVATGIVTWSGPRAGYGVLVELSHGNGYVTRYAHSSRVLVKVGDTVERGQAIAEVGSTGRSTGPHVHFEVLRNGAAINPAAFVGG